MRIDRDHSALRQQIGAQIQSARLAAGRRQADLARHLGVSTSTVTRIESGRYKLHVDRFMEIARWLGVDPADLFPEHFTRWRRADG